jgi:glycosyltransferase involved in cell wall biosynthesis
VTSKRIALIASRLHTGGGKVVGEKTAESLSLLCPESDILVVRPDGIAYEYHGHAHIRELVCPRQSLIKQFWWDRQVLGKHLTEFQPDWVWSLGNYPVAGKWRQSLLIHDPHLTFDPSYFQNETWKVKFKKWIGRQLLLSRLHLPQRFYCQTTAIREGASQQLGIPLEKIGLFPPGVEPDRTTNNAQPVVLNSQALKEVQSKKDKFRLFYPARCYGHKNHEVIVEAYSRYREELADTCCFLTISAEDHPIAKGFLERIEKEKLSSIVNIGPISRPEVAAIFAASDALLMPTKLETFGIPFVEAMQSRTPIITSNYDFVRAVCGDAALYLNNPDDPRELMQAILELQYNSTKRQTLKEKGLALSQSLPTWNESVDRVLHKEEIVRL